MTAASVFVLLSVSLVAPETAPARPAPAVVDWASVDVEAVVAAALGGAVTAGATYYAVGAVAHTMWSGALPYTQRQAWLMVAVVGALPAATSAGLLGLATLGSGALEGPVHAAVALAGGLLAGLHVVGLASLLALSGLAQRLAAQPGVLGRTKERQLDQAGMFGIAAGAVVYMSLPAAVGAGALGGFVAGQLGFFDLVAASDAPARNRE